MLGTKLLIVLASILLVEAQNISPWGSNGYSRASPFRRPFVRPRPVPVVTSVPNVPITTEKIEIITEPQAPITRTPPVIVPPQSTELTIIYPVNYKPATSSPPEPSSKPRVPIRLPSPRPRPVSNYVAPTPTPPLPPTPSHFDFKPRFPSYVTSQPVIPESPKPVEPVHIDIVTEAPVPTESVISQSKPEPDNRPASLELVVEPTERIEPSEIGPKPAPKPLVPVPEPSEPAPKPVEPVPKPVEPTSKPIEFIPEPSEPVPEPSEPVPEPSEPVPEPSGPVPKPSLETFEPPVPSVSNRPIVTEEPVQVKPFSDIVNPPVSESESPIVVANNPLYNKPMINWYPAQQRPKPTPVPSTTEIYSYIPTAATNKPIVRPVSKPWSKPSEDLYVNRLHDYNCRSSDGYESVLNQCDAYVECRQNLALHYVCPDGLHFNPAAKWPEYPCGYPSEVKCESQAVIQEPRPTTRCPHRYGFYPVLDGDCGQYIMCQEGVDTIMHCPPGLAFSSITNSCDWPDNVPGCNPNIFQGFTCPAPSLDKYGKQINNSSKYRYKNSCKQYIACHKGNPRLLSCDAGTSFDAGSGTCVDADQVVDCQY